MMDHDLRIPDIEVIVGAAGYDVAMFCFYKREDVHQGYDVVCALPSKSEGTAVKQILRDAITAIDTADWYDVDVLREDAAVDTAEPPIDVTGGSARDLGGNEHATSSDDNAQ